MKYKLSASVFYRLYGERVDLYHTGKRKRFVFNATANDILDCFKSESDIVTAIDKLSALYQVRDTDSFAKSISSFIQSLVELDILEA
jgi:hypothetical protein